MTNRISFELSASNQFLSDLFEDALDEAVSSEPMEVNSVEIVLKRIGEAELRPDRRRIHIFLPLRIHLKRPAGLFTVEGSGSINLHLVVEYNISSTLQLKAKTDLVSHEWLDKPILEIGALNIPVETLVNMVLKHHESIITAKLDQSLKSVSNLNAFLIRGLDQALLNINRQNLMGNAFELNLQDVELVEPIVDAGNVFVKGFLKPEIGINTKKYPQSKQVGFKWIDSSKLQGYSNMQLDIELPYDLLKEEFRNALQGMEVGGKQFDVRSMDIYGGDVLHIDLEIDEPIKAQVFIQGKPVYNELEGLLIIQDIDVKVNPANFIYKLTAPLVNKFIENKMREFFPLKVNEKLSKVVRSKIPSEIKIPNGTVLVSHERVTIDDLKFAEDRIVGKASIARLSVAVKRH